MNKINKTAFIAAAEALMADGFSALSAELMGIPYHSKIPFARPIEYDEYLVLKDFTYNHIDQDVNHGIYIFKAGEKISLRSDQDPQYFMPDRNNLQLIRIYSK